MGTRRHFYENIMVKKRFSAEKRLTNGAESVTIELVKTSSAVSVFSESLPLAVRQVNGNGT